MQNSKEFIQIHNRNGTLKVFAAEFRNFKRFSPTKVIRKSVFEFEGNFSPAVELQGVNVKFSRG